MCRQSVTACQTLLSDRPDHVIGGLAGLADRLATLPDPRHRRGRRHPMVAVLVVACSAVVAGARSFAAIGQWARSAPQNTLARLGARLPPTTAGLGVRVAPSAATIRRVIGAVCPAGLADLLGCDPAGADTMAVDGKTARGSRRADSPAAHLLAAMTGTGMTVTQMRVPGKTNEISCFTDLLEPYDLAGVVVTADALHTQRGHATWLVEPRTPTTPSPSTQPAQPVPPATPPALDPGHHPPLRPRPRSRPARDPRDPGADRH
jgi:hypothetical protein